MYQKCYKKQFLSDFVDRMYKFRYIFHILLLILNKNVGALLYIVSLGSLPAHTKSAAPPAALFQKKEGGVEGAPV